MSRAMWLPDAAKKTGYPIVYVDGWEDRGYSDGYDPSVVIAHHTAGPSGNGDMPSLSVVTNGRSDLPGPLCNYGLGRSGTIYIVASGKSNNAGEGHWTVGGTTFNSNYDTVGIEAENDGYQPWPDQQLDSYARLGAAILEELGHDDAIYVCSHEEWADPPGRKTDPHDIEGAPARDTVQEILEGNMPLNTADKEWIAQEVRQAIDELLAKDDDQTSRLSRAVMQHGGTFSGSGADADDNFQRTVVRIDQNTKP